MEHKAKISSGYRMRLILVAVMCLGMGSYFFYDGFVGYPGQNEALSDKLAVWDEIAGEDGFMDGDEAGKYKAEAEKRGWWSPDDPDNPSGPPDPHKSEHSETDILTQKILGMLCCSVGLFFLSVWVISGGRWVQVADGILSTSKGLKVAFDDIESIDSARWKTKGIALVHFENEAGKQTILLDDWKFEVKPTRAIYKAVREHVEGPLEEEKKPEDQAVAEATIDTKV